MPLSGNSPKPETRRALIVTPEAPYPMHGGGPLRTVSLIEYLRARYTLDLVVFRNEYPVPVPDGVFDRVLQVALPFHSRALVPRIARNLRRLSRQIPPLVDRFSGFESQLAPWLNGYRYDVALLEHFWTVTYEPLVRKHASRVVMDLHNVESQLSAAPFRSAASRLERELLPKFDVVLVTSSADAARIPVNSVIYANSIPDRAPVPRSEEFAIGMSGNFEFFPNLLGVRWFARQIWPQLKERFPRLEWRLIGRNPGAVERWTKGDSQIRIVGPVEDAVAELARCQAAIVPLQYGSGTRLKILEAWAAGTPVVSTAKGCEGLDVLDGEQVAIGNTPMQFLDAVSRVLSLGELRSRLRDGGRVLLDSRYVWSRAGKELESSGAL